MSLKFNKVDVLPTWSEDIVKEIFFVKDTGIYICTETGFEQYSDITNKTNSYELVLNDDGSLSCVKNGTEDGFVFNEDGSISIN